MTALTVCLGRFFPPAKISEPSERAEIMSNLVLIARDGNSYRFLTLQESKGVAPLWAVGVAVRETFQVEWSVKKFIPSLIHCSSHWAYTLTSNRFDEGWQNDKTQPFSLPDKTLLSLRPAIVAELNKRDSTHKGDRLEALLNDGLHESSYWCLQNIVVVLTWISIGMAAIAISMMLANRQSSDPIEH